MLLELLVVLPLLWAVYSCVALVRNLQQARTIGVPIRICPVSPTNSLWFIFEPLVLHVLDHLPFELGSFGRYSRRGWHFYDKARSHIELGDVWVLVTPRETWLHVADPEAINEIFARRIDFVRPTELYSTSFSASQLSFDLTAVNQRCWMYTGPMSPR